MTGRTRLYKIPSQGKIMGVCAGLADYLGMRVKIVRIITILAIIFTGIWWGVAGYFILGFVLDEKPEGLYRDKSEEDFWRKTRRDPSYSAGEVKNHFRDIEERTARMEAYMTSKRFKLERDIDALKD